MFDDNIINDNTSNLPIEYKLLEWRLLINRQLYEEEIINLEIFSNMENNILGRMTKIKNGYDL